MGVLPRRVRSGNAKRQRALSVGRLQARARAIILIDRVTHGAGWKLPPRGRIAHGGTGLGCVKGVQAATGARWLDSRATIGTNLSQTRGDGELFDSSINYPPLTLTTRTHLLILPFLLLARFSRKVKQLSRAAAARSCLPARISRWAWPPCVRGCPLAAFPLLRVPVARAGPCDSVRTCEPPPSYPLS